ncbi:MAG: ABC transporter permease [Muricomes sp.]
MRILKLVLPIFVLTFCALGFLIAPHNPHAMIASNKYALAGAAYPFGADQYGRCVFSRILYGGQVTLGIVLIGAAIVLIVGIVIGLFLGRIGEKKGLLWSSILDAVTAIPPLAYLIIFIGIWGNSIPTMLVALTVSLILRMIKLVKTQTEIELEKAYILCAVSSGASKGRVLFVHILPNIIRPLVHFLCLSCAEMIMSISAFSFIGLNLGDSVIDWGSMLQESRMVASIRPALAYLPILFIFACTLSFHVIAKQLEGGEENA